MKVTLALGCCVILFSPAYAGVFFQDDFESYTGSITNWNTGNQVSLTTNNCHSGSKCVKITFTDPGTSPYLFQKNISSYNLGEIYVRFYFKLDDASVCCDGGAKFFKLFGRRNSPQGYANSTFALGAWNSIISGVLYGNGGSVENDTQQYIRLDGSKTDSSVNLVTFTSLFDGRDEKWHSYEAYMKYNTNGKRDGEYKIWIDGELRMHATNVKNRNDLNARVFDEVRLADYHHNYGSKTWSLWYDDVVFSTSYIGLIGGNPVTQLSPPTNLIIQ